jgi:hypothetical protein
VELRRRCTFGGTFGGKLRDHTFQCRVDLCFLDIEAYDAISLGAFREQPLARHCQQCCPYRGPAEPDCRGKLLLIEVRASGYTPSSIARRNWAMKASTAELFGNRPGITH